MAGCYNGAKYKRDTKGGIIMAGYAVPTNRPFVTKKKLKMYRELTPEQKARRDYIRSHRFEIEVDPVTGEGKMKVTKL